MKSVLPLWKWSKDNIGVFLKPLFKLATFEQHYPRWSYTFFETLFQIFQTFILFATCDLCTKGGVSLFFFPSHPNPRCSHWSNLNLTIPENLKTVSSWDQDQIKHSFTQAAHIWARLWHDVWDLYSLCENANKKEISLLYIPPSETTSRS